MPLVVQKYGGSSLANPERINIVARRIGATVDKGDQVVVVVSAMGDSTDDLIDLAFKVTPEPDDRELDVLMSTGELVSCTLVTMALKHMGYHAISLSGAQAGIQTDSTFRKARILRIDHRRVVNELEKGNVVIVAGFQGVTQGMDITTLGRGGSDTTAVALAASLKAGQCEIYTDVEGVYTADPRVFPGARKLKEISYEEMLELATWGAKVMHPRAVELGWLYDVPIMVASSLTEASGTLIHRLETNVEDRNKVKGIAHDTDVAKVTIRRVPDRPGIAAAIFEPLADAGISVDTIVQNTSLENLTDVSFTTSRSELQKAMPLVASVARSIGAGEYIGDPRVGKVSIVGSGMLNTPGYAARMFRALYSSGINIQLITTSEIRITCIIDEGRIKDAVAALHKAFELEKE